MSREFVSFQNEISEKPVIGFLFRESVKNGDKKLARNLSHLNMDTETIALKRSLQSPPTVVLENLILALLSILRVEQDCAVYI